ncbi:KpsF/GutQ family sugar-phosphate isomerase [Salipiger marinus]|uniref:Arabinose-5-phosphate isomerase n=1 Tax=Salipiger marinus TaxID=555512 RepID=A0A1G8QJB4_9RHOB|nr:KpsF/GutQ family sugar-phosphate isomerase [Salipiger marinus]SDJ04822.1 arabinose-5-phosphate isomerase [Salipiger marinus]
MNDAAEIGGHVLDGFVTRFTEVVAKEADAVKALALADPQAIAAACQLIFDCRGRVICSGMGKSGHIARKIAATLSSTGTPAHFVHPGEASHGDLGMIQPGDVLLALSNSGETRELADVLTYAARRAIPMIAITKSADSALARHAAAVLLLPDMPEACSIHMAPTTSTTCSLVIGDAMAVAVMQARGFQREDFLGFHPGGKLGAQLLTVEHLMHKGAALPVLAPSASMEEAILEMTSKGFGIAAVVEDGRLLAVVTDGDLRRNIRNILDKAVSEVVNYTPKVIAPGALASEALGMMNALRVNALCVVGENNNLVGLIHLHDCLRAEVA